jgi:hypothetical protein
VRSIQVQVRPDVVERVLALAEEHGAPSPVVVRAEQGGAEWRLVLATVPNDRAGSFIAAVTDAADDAAFVLLPVGALPLGVPLDRMDERVRDVSRLSTLELVAGSLQSVGAWQGLLLYSVSPVWSAATASSST